MYLKRIFKKQNGIFFPAGTSKISVMIDLGPLYAHRVIMETSRVLPF